MKMTLEFELPDNEAEAKAALDGFNMLIAIEDFRERLRRIFKGKGEMYITCETNVLKRKSKANEMEEFL